MARVILVHGAWADGSSWSKVIPVLQKAGREVVAVQLPLTSLGDDVAVVRSAIDAGAGPVVLVGHSYGGSVITAAASGDPRAFALVYIAAFANDDGESGSAVSARFPQSPGGSFIRVDGKKLMTLDPAHFREAIAHDLPGDEAALLGAVQKPTSVACFGDTFTGVPAWKGHKSWYLVSSEDRTVHPDLQRATAKKIGATTREVPGSHLSLRSHPAEVAKLILDASP